MESFLKNVPSKSPYLVYTGADKSAGSEEQIFLIIDEDVLLECTQVSKDHCLFTSSLLTLIAIYYSCNLQYEDDRKHLQGSTLRLTGRQCDQKSSVGNYIFRASRQWATNLHLFPSSF